MDDFRSFRVARIQGESISDAPSLVSLIRAQAINKPNTVIHTFMPDGEHEGPVRTFAGLDHAAKNIAAVLQERYNKGDRAILIFPPGLEFIDAFFASFYAGMVAVPAFPPNPSQREQTLTRLQALAVDSRCSVILTTQAVQQFFEPAAMAYPPLNQIPWMAIDQLPDDAYQSWREYMPEPDELAYFQYTSGSTRTPHGVCLTHRNLVHNSARICSFFELTEADLNVSWLPMYHNLGLIGAILQPFFTGMRSYLMPPQVFLENPLLWLKAITHYKATLAGSPNFGFDLCALRIPPEQRQGLDLSSWRLAFNGAEPVLADTLSRFTAAYQPYGFSPSAFYPCYGLAEATLMVTGGKRGAGAKILRVDPAALEASRVQVLPEAGQPLVGCGRPFPDQEMMIVDPDHQTLLPEGQVGEIWLRGPSVSPGYWNHAEDTEETFHAFLSTGEGPYLRTGDLGFIQNGECFITGRLKELIIIRGRNLYPQDIEHTVLSANTALVPNGGAAFSIRVDGEEKLAIVQEVDARDSLDLPGVSAAMRQAITASHNVQLYAIALVPRGAVPRTVSGKIQRRLTCKLYLEGKLNALYASVLQTEPTSPTQAAPVSGSLLQSALIALGPDKARDLLERYLREQISHVMQIPSNEIDSETALNTLGLDSVSTAELLANIQTTTGFAIPMESIYEGASLRDVVQQVAGHLSEKAELPFEKQPAPSQAALAQVQEVVEVVNEYVLTYGQCALWFVQQLNPDDITHNIVYAITLHTAVNPAAFRRAMQKLVLRHAVMRTRFAEVDGQPVQRVYSGSEHFDFSVEDASGWSQDQADTRINHEVLTPFNLEIGPLVRLRLLKRSEQEYTVILGMHHIITDLWSMAMLAYEIIELYAAEVQEREPVLKALRGTYQEAVTAEAEMLSGPEGESHRVYWKERLAGEHPVLQLPGDHPRPAALSGRAAATSLTLDHELVSDLKSLAAARDATLFSTLLTAFKVLIYRYTGLTDFLLATPKAMRNRRNATTVGYFINPVILRAHFAEGITFAGLLDQTHQEVQADFQHDAYPFPLLVEQLQPARAAGSNPLFQVFFSWQKTHRMMDSRLITALALNRSDGPFESSGIAISTVAVPARVTLTDLALLAAESEDDLHLTVEYSTDLFEAGTMERLLGHLAVMLHAAVTNPDQPIAHLPLLTEAENRQLEAWNAPHHGRHAPQETLPVHAAILQQASRTPTRTAVEAGTLRLTYAELAESTHVLAARLAALGAGPGKIVALFADRSSETIAGLLAILQTGSAYLPLDPDYPPERLTYMLADSQAAILLTRSNLINRLPEVKLPTLYLDRDGGPDTRGAGGQTPGDRSAVPVRLDQPAYIQPAYIMYTSGSTGQPKGVLISHQAIAHHCRYMQSYYQMTPDDRVLQFASLNFDASLEQIFTSLMSGATLVLRDNSLWDPGAFSQKIAALHLSVVNVPPAYWEAWAAAEVLSPAPQHNPQLRLVIVGGDVMQPDVLARWQQTPMAKTRLINAYGPTETTITATAYEVPQTPPEPGSHVPIGRPLAGRTAWVLNSALQPAPVGVPGELYLGGECLAIGYWQRPDLTAEKFITDPFHPASGARLYRTGDLARCLPDGCLEFLGRADRQIKYLGIRIEPGEIEANLKQHPAVKNAAVVYTPGPAERLTAYVSASQKELKPAQLTAFLALRLPQYMIPADISILDELPLTPSGKLDRDALARAASQVKTSEVDTYVAPRNEIEAYLAGLWTQLLRVEKVGVKDNFFSLGGHSLLATQVMARVRSHYQVDIPLRDLFTEPTIERFAAAIIAGMAGDEDEQDLDALLKEIEEL